MMQGTTPTHEFGLPFAAGLVKEVRITYTQDKATVLEKTENEVTLSGESIKVELTQEETLGFRARHNVSIQVKVLTTDGNVMVSQPMSVSVGEAFNKEVLAL